MRFFGHNTKAEPQNGNCYALFKSRFSKDLSATFVEREDGVRYSFADLEDISARFAGLFEQLGLVPGDRIVAQVEKSPEVIFLYIACLRFGAFFVPLERSLQRREVEYILRDAMPALIVCRPENETMFAELAREIGNPFVRTLGQSADGSLMEESEYLPPRSQIHSAISDDIACILYTSGTTGRQKGVMLTHGNFASNARSSHDAWRLNDQDVLLHALSVSHHPGLHGINLSLYNPNKILFLRQRNGQYNVRSVLESLPKSTIFLATPARYAQFLALDEFTPSLCRNIRLFLSLGAPLSEKMFAEFKSHIGKPLIDRYGMTETCVNASSPIGHERAGSCGKPLPGIEMRITNEKGDPLGIDVTGNIEVRGPSVCRGYWNDPEKTGRSFRDNGFFITGDLGRFDEYGYLWVVGRAKDVIIFHSVKVYPKEVESSIDALDGVEESAVFGIPHAEFGEYVAAAVKRKPGAYAVTEDSIIAALKGEIADYKIPRHIYFPEEIPRNAMGKVQKNILREQYKTTFADS